MRYSIKLKPKNRHLRLFTHRRLVRNSISGLPENRQFCSMGKDGEFGERHTVALSKDNAHQTNEEVENCFAWWDFFTNAGKQNPTDCYTNLQSQRRPTWVVLTPMVATVTQGVYGLSYHRRRLCFFPVRIWCESGVLMYRAVAVTCRISDVKEHFTDDY